MYASTARLWPWRTATSIIANRILSWNSKIFIRLAILITWGWGRYVDVASAHNVLQCVQGNNLAYEPRAARQIRHGGGVVEPLVHCNKADTVTGRLRQFCTFYKLYLYLWNAHPRFKDAISVKRGFLVTYVFLPYLCQEENGGVTEQAVFRNFTEELAVITFFNFKRFFYVEYTNSQFVSDSSGDYYFKCIRECDLRRSV